MKANETPHGTIYTDATEGLEETDSIEPAQDDESETTE